MHRPSAWAGAIAIFLLLLICGVRLGGDALYDFPSEPSAAALPRESVVVVLAGGKHRLEAAFSLFAGGIGSRLWVIGAGRHATATSLTQAHASELRMQPERASLVQVETESRNTIENAFAVKRLLEQSAAPKNLVLITSPYHMRRAQLMIEQQLPSGVRVIPFIPPAAEVGKTNWWHTWGGISITVEEAFKLGLASVLAPRLGYF